MRHIFGTLSAHIIYLPNLNLKLTLTHFFEVIPVCVEFRLPRLFSHWDSESEEFLRHPCSGKHDCPFTIHFTLLHTMLHVTDWGVASEKQ